MKRTAFLLAAACSAALVTGCAGWRSDTPTYGGNAMGNTAERRANDAPGTMSPSGTTGTPGGNAGDSSAPGSTTTGGGTATTR